MTSLKKLDAVVVGASWAGLWLLYLLKKSGFTVRLLDACEGVGGVWYYTNYSGCRVDTEVPFYEFSLPELWKNWKWSEKFSSRAEIRDYLYWVCQKLNIYEDIDFGMRVGVVGTGASGIQIIENVAPDVKKLVVFQRTPNMATPLRQKVLNDDLRGEMKTRYPSLFDQRISRFGFNVDTSIKKTFDDNAEQREAFY
ncbi:hypothetical protein LTS17_012719 [Exophiala oligosperma]